MIENGFKKSTAARVLYHVLFWLGMLILLPLFVSKGKVDFLNQVTFFAVSLPFDICAVYISFYILIPAFLKQKRILTFILLFVVNSLFFILLQRAFIFYIAFPERWSNHSFTQDLSGFILIIFIIYIIALAVKLLKLWYEKNQEFNEISRNNLEIQLKLKEAELSLLKAQLHPHFLFNTLNNLYGLTLEKSELAPVVVLRISDMLHYMLHESNKTMVPLEKEIKFLRDYLDLERLRFGEELKLDFIEEGNFNDFEIAPLILIPFVENAFKHGANLQTGAAEVSIHILTDTDIFKLQVTNSVDPMPNQKENEFSGGVGLQNVKKRLDLLYKNLYKLDIQQRPDEFHINLELRRNGRKLQ